MANRRSNAIDRIVELAKAPNRGALDQHSDETLFHLADLHDGAVRPSQLLSQPPRRSRWLQAVGTAALLAIVLLTFSWAHARARARDAEEQARLLTLEAEQEALDVIARGIRVTKARKVGKDMLGIMKTERVQNPAEWIQLIETYMRLVDEAERSVTDGPEK